MGRTSQPEFNTLKWFENKSCGNDFSAYIAVLTFRFRIEFPLGHRFDKRLSQVLRNSLI